MASLCHQGVVKRGNTPIISVLNEYYRVQRIDLTSQRPRWNLKRGLNVSQEHLGRYLSDTGHLITDHAAFVNRVKDILVSLRDV